MKRSSEEARGPLEREARVVLRDAGVALKRLESSCARAVASLSSMSAGYAGASITNSAASSIIIFNATRSFHRLARESCIRSKQFEPNSSRRTTLRRSSSVRS